MISLVMLVAKNRKSALQWLKTIYFTFQFQAQNMVSPEEWDAFMEALRQPLPVTFRVTGFKRYVN
jgi:16S rRNA C967 or C1407 C5-methylase (RsmB/RsmF family)